MIDLILQAAELGLLVVECFAVRGLLLAEGVELLAGGFCGGHFWNIWFCYLVVGILDRIWVEGIETLVFLFSCGFGLMSVRWIYIYMVGG